MKKKLLNNNGFTLIEMILVLFVISVLLILVIPNVTKQKEKIDHQGTDALVTVVETQIELYQLEKGNVESVTFEMLEKAGYLKHKQVKNAKDKGIKINGTAVSGPP
ncbi:competence type IV pilus major pilin ComGC [Carnobacterium divergens]|uniref:competence type IV pilus major pilin ComGC n=1 Tax=Carnobacterium divergens TaxID=2748 RepID=UPI0039B08082